MLHLAFLSFIRRPLTRLILLFLIALACALPVFLLQTAGGLYDGINRAIRKSRISRVSGRRMNERKAR